MADDVTMLGKMVVRKPMANMYNYRFFMERNAGTSIPNVFAMPKDELVDSRVSLTQVRKAVEALHSHELKKKENFEENQLLPAKEQNLWLNVTVKAIPSGHKLKPVKMYAFSSKKPFLLLT